MIVPFENSLLYPQASAPTIGHMGFLPRSHAHISALTGRDLMFDFADTLGQEPEVTVNPHLLMEKIDMPHQKRKMF